MDFGILIYKRSFKWEPFLLGYLFTSLSLPVCVYPSLCSSFAFASVRAPGPKSGKSLMVTFWNNYFMSIPGYHISGHWASGWIESCVFVIPRPPTSYKTIALGRRLAIFFLVSFQKWVKFCISPWFQAVNLALAPGPTRSTFGLCYL